MFDVILLFQVKSGLIIIVFFDHSERVNLFPPVDCKIKPQKRNKINYVRVYIHI